MAAPTELEQLASHAFRRRALLILVAGGALILVAAWLIHVMTRASQVGEAMAVGQYAEAVALVGPAAAAGDATAQTTLGNLLFLGMGTDRDYATARHWYALAAAEEQTAAMVNIAHLYREGFGVQQDAMHAYAWYRAADRRGDAAAERYLGLIASEWSLSPLMMQTADKRWPNLASLLADEQ